VLDCSRQFVQVSLSLEVDSADPMGFEPVKLGPLDCTVFELNRRFAGHLAPAPSSESLDQVSANLDRTSGRKTPRAPDFADDREMH
jgi:hypothetical protein